MFGTDAAAVAGDLISDSADESSPVEVPLIRDVRVPGWVSKDTLSIILSISGDASRLGSLLEHLLDRGSAIGCIAPEGALTEACRSLGGTAVPVPEGMGADETIMFMAGAAARMVQATGVFDAADRLKSALDAIESEGYAFPEPADFSARLEGRVPAVYSTSDVRACARWWKCLSAGSDLAFSGELPEFDHNELVGWSDPNVHAPELGMVVLRGRSHPGLVDDIVGCMEEVLQENGRSVMSVPLGEGSALVRDLRGMAIASAVHRTGVFQ